MNEDIHKSNPSLRTQGLVWLLYKRARVCVCVMLARSRFPVCGINLIMCLVRPHGNRHCCPFPSPARWPLQWPAPGPTERDRDRERERQATHLPSVRTPHLLPSKPQWCTSVCASCICVYMKRNPIGDSHQTGLLRADQTHTPSKSPRHLWFLSSLLHTPFLFVCWGLTLL